MAEKKTLRFLVGIVTGDTVFAEFALFLRMMKFPENSQVLFAMNKASGVDVARNMIVENAPSDTDYILFLNDDVLVPADAVERLMARGKDIVSGLYFSTSPPFYPHIYKSDGKGRYDNVSDYEKNSLVEVDAVRAGALLVKKKVFDKMGAPFFQHAVQKNDLTEDFFFCRKAKEAGFKVFCDTSLVCSHVGVSMVNENAWESMKDQAKRKG